MIEFSLLSSGSKANCLYVSDGATRVLVDCGLSAREAARRLMERGIAPDSIQGIVLTHEHSDHCAGVVSFSKRHSIPVFGNRGTFKGLSHIQPFTTVKQEIFTTGEPFTIGGLAFDPFSIMHDAEDPVGFRITGGEHTLGVVTDLGQVTTLVAEKTRLLDALILESNHDPDLLWEAPYPWSLKKRISSRSGHLSNQTAGNLLRELSQEEGCRLQVVVGAHISENSNHPELVEEALKSSWARSPLSLPQIALGSVRHSTPLYRL